MNRLITACLLLLMAGALLAPAALFGQSPEPRPVSLEEALRRAPLEERKILIDVYASWCPYCQRMHSDVYTSDEVLTAIADHFLWVKINIESSDYVTYQGHQFTEAEFAVALDNKNIPTTYFMNEEGAILGAQPGYLEVDVFSHLLNFIGSDAFLVQSFDEYMRTGGSQ